MFEWQENSKLEYYFAQLTAEIRRIGEGFSTKPKEVKVEDCLLKFGRKEEQEAIEAAKSEPIEIGPGATQAPILDEKWRAVNERAKAAWAARLGLVSLEAAADGQSNTATGDAIRQDHGGLRGPTERDQSSQGSSPSD